MAYVILRKIRPSLRIAIGTVALGLAIDGVASHLGGRGVNTAPAVLLGMGFAADYLSHAASGHTPLETTCRHVGALHSIDGHIHSSCLHHLSSCTGYRTIIGHLYFDGCSIGYEPCMGKRLFR